MKRLVLIALLPAALMICGGTAQARTSCTAPTHIGRDKPNMGELDAHGVSCESARAAIGRGHLSRGGNLVTAGFQCHVTHRFHTGGVTLGAEITCRGERGRFSFSWAT